MDNQIIVFEEISPAYNWLLRWYLWRKKKVYFLRINKLWRRDTREDHIKKIDFNFVLNTFQGIYPDLAFDNLSNFFEVIRDNRIVKKLKQLYNSEAIELAFKKALNNRLSRFYYLNYILGELQKLYSKKRIGFIPSNGIEVYRTDGCEIYDYIKFYKLAQKVNATLYDTSNVEFPLWVKLLSYINAIKRKLKSLLKAMGGLFLPYLRWLKSSNQSNLKRYYNYAIMIVSPLRQFANKIQRVDFMVDDREIKREETIFLSYRKLNFLNQEYLKKNNLDYLDNLDAFISLKDMFDILPAYLFLLFSLSYDSLILDTSVNLLYYYLRWESLVKNIKINNLITHCDFGIQSIARNIILEQSGVKTYYYMDTANYGCFFIKNGSSIKNRHNYFGFLYYDFFISWCDRVSQYFYDSKSNFKQYVNLGCLWAEHLRRVYDGRIESDFLDMLSRKGYQKRMRIVSVFDSTFHDSSLTTYYDGIKYLQDIGKLLNDLENIFVVLKEKKPRDYHQTKTHRFREILDVYTQLDNHPRCFCIKGGEKRWANASEIIAFSDLTISFPFTSTTFEALSARKKAIWHDATDKWRGTFYDNIPGLVCHNYQELLRRVNELLFEISHEEYNNYLNKYIKNRVESYLDGNALTRFRKFLISSNQKRRILRTCSQISTENRLIIENI